MQTSPRLSIGMAVYDDYHGAYFTLQSLRMNNDLSQCELIIVDNNPGSAHGKELANLCRNWISAYNMGVKYIPMAENTGTTQPRNAVFDSATGDAVLCMDSHVLLLPGTIQKLLNWYDSNPDSQDLLSGPLLMDNLNNFSTQYNDVWRAEMWGIWGNAWECCKGGLHFSGIENPADQSKAMFIAMSAGQVPVSFCSKCKKVLPELAHNGHQDQLKNLGYKPLGLDISDAPFEIQGQGLGLFTCRRNAWNSLGGFNKDFRGFGGEEMYIHTKFRLHGRKNLCLPFLKWLHRFARPDGVKFPLTRWNKIRNYVLGHNELGLGLEPVYNHFVKSNLMKEEHWQHLIADPINNVVEPDCKTCGAPAQPASIPSEITAAKNPADLFKYIQTNKRDLDEHFDKLIELGMKCNTIIEFTKRKESTIAFTQANPAQMFSYNTEANTPAIVKLREFVPANVLILSAKESPAVDSIPETDLLFIDSQHTADRAWSELDKFGKSVKRYIVFHDTNMYGENGEDGGPGLLPAIRRFMQAYPEWSVIYHTQNQYGLTVLGKLAEDKPKLPSALTMIGNFASAIAAHIADGNAKVELPVYERRLEKCTTCPQRTDNQCAVCGCFISAKASWRSSGCPLGIWEPIV